MVRCCSIARTEWASGVRTAHLNQPVEVASLRPQFADFLGMPGKRPDLVVRFGRGPTLPRSLESPRSPCPMTWLEQAYLGG